MSKQQILETVKMYGSPRQKMRFLRSLPPEELVKLCDGRSFTEIADSIGVNFQRLTYLLKDAIQQARLSEVKS